MAFDTNEQKGPIEHSGSKAEENKLLPVPPAKIDEILLDALAALEQTRRLHENTPNPETKRQTKQILASLQSALMQLAPLGVHSVRRLARVVV